jgi:putative spermidine/putrescine transport system substrate-binding protein
VRHHPVRSFLALATTLALVAACAPGTASPDPADGDKPFEGRTIRVATWGGDWGDGVRESAGTLFEEQTGATVEYVFGNPVDNLTRLLAAPEDDPPFDVMQMDNLTQQSLIEQGLIQPVDHSRLPLGDLFPEAVTTEEYGPAFTLVPTVITWSPDQFERLGLADPTSFEDLFVPELRGRVAYPGMRVGFAPLIISGLANAWFNDPMAVEQAMERLSEIEPRIYGATPEMATWLTGGEVYAAVTHTAQVQVMRNQGFDLGMVYPQAGDRRSMVYWNMTNIVRGTQNLDMAEEWISVNLSCEAQEAFGRRNGVLPTCRSVAETFGQDEELQTISVTPEDMAAMFQTDPAVIVERRESWNDAWNRIMGT